MSWQPEVNPWMQQAKIKDGGLTVISPSEGSYYLDEPKQVISLARLIKDPVYTISFKRNEKPSIY